jgi:hypothetical protein
MRQGDTDGVGEGAVLTIFICVSPRLLLGLVV